MLPIVLSPDPRLGKVCEPCTPGDKNLKKLAKQMTKAMYKNNGVGLAAPQVGETIRLVVVDCDYDPDDARTQDPLVLVNPEIVELKGDPVTDNEGCLSCPGVYIPVERQPWARVRFYDLDGEMWEVSGDGLFGRCLQHEIDHLNGVTLFESCLPSVRLTALRQYEEAKAAGAKPGDVGV